MSEKTERLREKLRQAEKYPLCTEFAWLITGSYKLMLGRSKNDKKG
jgi:hypothetical protein